MRLFNPILAASDDLPAAFDHPAATEIELVCARLPDCPKTGRNLRAHVRRHVCWRITLVLLGLSIAGCARYRPPPPAQERAGTEVNASAGRTWDAVVELFAARNIAIRNMERVSGFIAAEPVSVGVQMTKADVLAHCGSVGELIYAPTNATYNVLVRGDSARAIVKVTVLWRRLLPPEIHFDCTTFDRFEPMFEAAVKALAEGRPRSISAPATGPPALQPPMTSPSQSRTREQGWYEATEVDTPAQPSTSNANPSFPEGEIPVAGRRVSVGVAFVVDVNGTVDATTIRWTNP
jgi:hypothetical protein